MRRKITYISNNGVEFDNENDCKKYEEMRSRKESLYETFVSSMKIKKCVNNFLLDSFFLVNNIWQKVLHL